MMYSMFIYGHVITESNQYLNFIEPNEDNIELTATLTIRSYDLTSFIKEVARAMTEAGKLDYFPTLDRETRKITITSDDSFNFVLNGANELTSPFGLMGVDQAIARVPGISQTSDFASGKVYEPQAPLWQYTPFKYWGGASDGAVTKAASGRATIVSFGDKKNMECTISAITNNSQRGISKVLDNPNGIQDALDFLEYITKKRPVEFLEDKNKFNEYTRCRLEKTSTSKDGIRYRLFEGTNGKKIKDYYNTKALTFESLEI